MASAVVQSRKASKHLKISHGCRMKEIINDVTAWIDDGQEKIAIATVLMTWGSAPRRPGSKMAYSSAGDLSGSVSGGCVEGAVIEASINSLESGQPELLHFGVVNETAWSVGLACGGSIDIFVENLDLPAFYAVRSLIREERAGVAATVVIGEPAILGQKLVLDQQGIMTSSMNSELQARVSRAISESEKTGVIALDAKTKIFVEQIRTSPILVAVGGGEISIALTQIATLMGYYTIVIDPRSVFATNARFPHIDRLIHKWPRSAFSEIELTPDTAVALLTHDPKIDDPSLKILLDQDVFYIGALGSPKTHAMRLARLRRMGFGEEQTDHIHAPIGLDIGAANPQEIALAIMSEIVAERNRQGLVPA
jgi:xanthine dehydrogenase accessory factor